VLGCWPWLDVILRADDHATKKLTIIIMMKQHPTTLFLAFVVFLVAFQSFLVSHVLMHHDDSGASSVQTVSSPARRRVNSSPISIRPRRYAYAFYLPVIIKDNNLNLHGNESFTNEFQGRLQHILVSSRILKDEGSQADVIAMVHYHSSSSNDDDIPKRLVDKLQKEHDNIRFEIIPSHIPTEFAKLWILTLVDYSRVIYMDGMPFCNLDYLFAASDPDDPSEASEPILNENLLLAWRYVLAY
jgi:hypothetical protein